MSAHAPIDIHIDEHPSNAWMTIEELGLHVLAIVYCNRNLTDGFVPETQIRKFGSCGRGPKVIRRLVAKGRWEAHERDGERGYLIVGFLEHNRSRAEVESLVLSRKRAGSVGGARSATQRFAQANAQASASPVAQAPVQQVATASAHTLLNPIQSNPIQSNPTEKKETLRVSKKEPENSPDEPKPATRRGTRLPADWTPSAELVAWSHEQRIDGERHVDEFRDYWHSRPGNAGIKLDWEATFRNWLRSASKRGDSHPWSPPPQKRVQTPVAAPDGPLVSLFDDPRYIAFMRDDWTPPRPGGDS